MANNEQKKNAQVVKICKTHLELSEFFYIVSFSPMEQLHHVNSTVTL